MAELRSSEVLSLVYGGGKGTGSSDLFTVSLKNQKAISEPETEVEKTSFENVVANNVTIYEASGANLCYVTIYYTPKHFDSIKKDSYKTNVIKTSVGEISEWVSPSIQLDETNKQFIVTYYTTKMDLKGRQVDLTLNLEYTYVEKETVFTLSGTFSPIKIKKAKVSWGTLTIKTTQNPGGYKLQAEKDVDFDEILFYSQDNKFKIKLNINFTEGTWSFDYNSIVCFVDSEVSISAFRNGLISFDITGIKVSNSYNIGDNEDEEPGDEDASLTYWPNIFFNDSLTIKPLINMVYFSYSNDYVFRDSFSSFSNSIPLTEYIIYSSTGEDITDKYNWTITGTYKNENTITLSIVGSSETFSETSFSIKFSGKLDETKKKYSINFNSTGGTEVIDLTNLDKIPDLSSYKPTKEGSEFEGWYLDASCTKKANAKDPLTENIMLYAGWKPGTYTLTYDYKYGNQSYSEEIGSQIISLKNSIDRPGYRFDGWYAEESFQNKITVLNLVKNTTVYAKWEEVEYNITFTSDKVVVKPEDLATQKHSFMPSKVDLPKIETIGYKVKDWRVGSSNGSEPSYGSKLTTDIDLYAHWEELKYEIKLELNGGSISNSTLSLLSFNNVISLNEQPTRPGYKFEGWYWNSTYTRKWEESDRTGIVILDGSGTQIVQWTNQQATLYAKWSEIYYTVSLNLNGGLFISGESWKTTLASKYSFLNGDIQHGTNPVIPSNLNRYSYDFKGWKWNDVWIQKNMTSIKLTQDIILEAIWEAKMCTVTFHYGNPLETQDDSTEKVPFYSQLGRRWQESLFVQGYKFLGWYTGAAGSGTRYTEASMILNDLHLYAHYEVTPKKVTIIYPGGRSETKTISQFPTILSSEKVRNGYNFIGWFKGSADSGIEIDEGDIIVEECTIYAKCEPIEYFVIFKNSPKNEKEGIKKRLISFSNNNLYELFKEDIPKTGYNFKYFYWDMENKEKEVITDIDLTRITDNNTPQITYYISAKYEAKKYKIEYIHPKEVGSPEISKPQTIATHDEPVDLTRVIPIAAGYTFSGWYLDADFTQPVVNFFPTGDIQLYSKWLNWGQISYKQTVSILSDDKYVWVAKPEVQSYIWNISGLLGYDLYYNYDTNESYIKSIRLTPQTTPGPSIVRYTLTEGDKPAPYIRIYKDKTEKDYEDILYTRDKNNHQWELPSSVTCTFKNDNGQSPIGFSKDPNSTGIYISYGSSVPNDVNKNAVLELYCVWGALFTCNYTESAYYAMNVEHDSTQRGVVSLIQKDGTSSSYDLWDFPEPCLMPFDGRWSINIQSRTDPMVYIKIRYQDSSGKWVTKKNNWLNSKSFKFEDLNEGTQSWNKNQKVQGDVHIDVEYTWYGPNAGFGLLSNSAKWDITITINKQGYNPLA